MTQAIGDEEVEGAQWLVPVDEVEFLLHVQVGSASRHLREELCEDLLLAGVGSFALGVLLLEHPAVGLGHFAALVEGELLLGREQRRAGHEPCEKEGYTLGAY